MMKAASALLLLYRIGTDSGHQSKLALFLLRLIIILTIIGFRA